MYYSKPNHSYRKSGFSVNINAHIKIYFDTGLTLPQHFYGKLLWKLAFTVFFGVQSFERYYHSVYIAPLVRPLACQKKILHTGDIESLNYADSSTNIFVSAGVKKGAHSIFFCLRANTLKKKFVEQYKQKDSERSRK